MVRLFGRQVVHKICYQSRNEDKGKLNPEAAAANRFHAEVKGVNRPCLLGSKNHIRLFSKDQQLQKGFLAVIYFVVLFLLTLP